MLIIADLLAPLEEDRPLKLQRLYLTQGVYLKYRRPASVPSWHQTADSHRPPTLQRSLQVVSWGMRWTLPLR